MLSICGCLLSSCSLDLQPENGLTYSNSFNTEKELNATTTSILYYINTVVGNNYVLSTAGMKADEILDGKQLREWNPRTVITSEYSWKGLYDIIFEANLLLDNIREFGIRKGLKKLVISSKIRIFIGENQ